MVKVNMANVGGTFELMENGRYLATFAKKEVKTSGPKAKNPGSKYFNLEFHIDGDEHPEYKNRRMWGTTGGTVNSLWAVKELLIKLGYPADELDAEDPDAENPDELTPDQLVEAIDAMLQQVMGGKIYLMVATETYDKPNRVTGETEPAQRNIIDSYESIYDAA